MGIASLVMLIVITATAAILGSWILLSDYKSKANLWFAGTAITIILWNVFAYLGYSTTDVSQAAFYFRLNFAAVSLFFLAFYRFTIFFPIKYDKSSRLIDIPIAIISILFAGISIFTNYIIQDVSIPQPGGLTMDLGSLGVVFYIFAILLTIYILRVMVIKSYSISRAYQGKIRVFLIGSLIYALCNMLFSIGISFLYPNNYNFTQLGDFSAIFFLGFTAYAMVIHHLFDVKFAIIRSITYSLVLATLAAIYLVIAFLLSMVFDKEAATTWQTISSLITSVFLAFLIQPLKRFFDKITNNIFYKDRYHTDEFYSRLNDALTLNTNLRGILKRASYEIAKTLKCDQVFFFVNTNDGHFVSEGTPHHKQLPKDDAEKISQYCGSDYHAIAASMLDTNNPLQQLLESHGIEIVLPLTQLNQIVGYLCLGNNLASGYTGRDVKVLNMVADEMVIAVQNALALQKILELNLSLKQRISNATKELRTKNAQLRNLDKVKDEFVSVAAHELRTPMTVIRGFLNLLQRKQLGPINKQQYDILGKMDVNTKNLIDLVNNMLDLSKLEANKLTIDLTDNFLSDLVNASLDKISLLYEGKGVDLKYDKESVRIKTDAEKFQRVIVNLLSNAYKFTPAGGSVTISSKIDDEKRMVTICVADTGIGMPPEDIGRLFKKFSQVDNYLQKTSGGTGLGLSICKQMVEKMGGEIWVESTQGVGSQFYFTAPMSEDLIKQ